MRDKNIRAISLLLRIAHTEGNHLRDSWGDVLDCISEFEKLQNTTVTIVPQ
jgi:brefeldin A-inhibited guanine nucleotide-exchange protein